MIRCVIWLAAAGLACGSERRSEAAHAGIPDRAPPSTSTVDPDSTELRFTSVSAGEEFTCGLAQEGRAYCWGSNEVGQLGDGSKMGELVNRPYAAPVAGGRSEEHTSELQSLAYLVCRLLLEKKKKNRIKNIGNMRK